MIWKEKELNQKFAIGCLRGLTDKIKFCTKIVLKKRQMGQEKG